MPRVALVLRPLGFFVRLGAVGLPFSACRGVCLLSLSGSWGGRLLPQQVGWVWLVAGRVASPPISATRSSRLTSARGKFLVLVLLRVVPVSALSSVCVICLWLLFAADIHLRATAIHARRAPLLGVLRGHARSALASQPGKSRSTRDGCRYAYTPASGPAFLSCIAVSIFGPSRWRGLHSL